MLEPARRNSVIRISVSDGNRSKTKVEKKNWITCVPLKETGPDQCLTFEGFSVGPPDGGCCARWTRPQIMIFGNKKWQNGSFSTVYPCFDRGMGIPIAR